MKKLPALIGLAVGRAGAIATVDENGVKSPTELSVISANTSDAQARLAAVEAGTMTAATLTLSNGTEGATASLVAIADQADDAGDRLALVATDSAGFALQSDVSSKGTLATKATVGTDGLVSSLVGYDAIGAVDLDIGSADVTEVTITTDGGSLDVGSTASELLFTALSTNAATIKGADASGAADTVLDTTGAGTITVGSADVTAVTVTTDGTGDSEVVLPNASIGDGEIDFSSVTYADLSGNIASASLTNAIGSIALVPNSANYTNVIVSKDDKTNTIVVINGQITGWTITQ